MFSLFCEISLVESGLSKTFNEEVGKKPFPHKQNLITQSSQNKNEKFLQHPL